MYQKLLFRKSRLKKSFYLDNRDRMKELKNHDKNTARKKIFSDNRYETDINFWVFHKTGSRKQQTLRGKTKSSSTLDILILNISSY